MLTTGSTALCCVDCWELETIHAIRGSPLHLLRTSDDDADCIPVSVHRLAPSTINDSFTWLILTQHEWQEADSWEADQYLADQDSREGGMCENRQVWLIEIWGLSWAILETKKSANVEHSCLFSSSFQPIWSLYLIVTDRQMCLLCHRPNSARVTSRHTNRPFRLRTVLPSNE